MMMTTYHLHISEDAPTIADIAERLAGVADGTPDGVDGHDFNVRYWCMVLQGQQDASWDHHCEHMQRVSPEWPDIVFTLEGVPDEADEQWIEYHCGGLVQREERGSWTPPPFDPDKLAG